LLLEPSATPALPGLLSFLVAVGYNNTYPHVVLSGSAPLAAVWILVGEGLAFEIEIIYDNSFRIEDVQLHNRLFYFVHSRR
jgi:hypothetical protein